LDTDETKDYISRAVADKIDQTDTAEWYCSEPGISMNELQRRKQHYQAYKDSMMALRSQQTSRSQQQATFSNGSAMPPRNNYLNAQCPSVSSQGSNFSNTLSAPGPNAPVMPYGVSVSSQHMVQPNQNANQARREVMEPAVKGKSGGMGFGQSLNSNNDAEQGLDGSLPNHTNTNFEATFGIGAPQSQDDFGNVDFGIDIFSADSPIDKSILDEVARLGEANPQLARGAIASPQLEEPSFDWDEYLDSLEENSQKSSEPTLL
jgi:hypothetical protein